MGGTNLDDVESCRCGAAQRLGGGASRIVPAKPSGLWILAWDLSFTMMDPVSLGSHLHRAETNPDTTYGIGYYRTASEQHLFRTAVNIDNQGRADIGKGRHPRRVHEMLTRRLDGECNVNTMLPLLTAAANPKADTASRSHLSLGSTSFWIGL